MNLKAISNLFGILLMLFSLSFIVPISISLLYSDSSLNTFLITFLLVLASMFFLAVFIHMFRSLYYGSYKEPREVLWILGVVIFLLMIITAFMGYVLVWGQMSFWGATVITNLVATIPVVGESILTLLLGGFSVDNPTYSCHAYSWDRWRPNL